MVTCQEQFYMVTFQEHFNILICVKNNLTYVIACQEQLSMVTCQEQYYTSDIPIYRPSAGPPLCVSGSPGTVTTASRPPASVSSWGTATTSSSARAASPAPGRGRMSRYASERRRQRAAQGSHHSWKDRIGLFLIIFFYDELKMTLVWTPIIFSWE